MQWLNKILLLTYFSLILLFFVRIIELLEFSKKLYCIELTIKLNPIPFVVQRKEHRDAKRLYAEVVDSIKKGNQGLLELTCEKVEDKRITVVMSEITAVQIYEKTSSSTSKRPGFSLQN